MTLPPNVVRTRDLEWHTRRVPEPFGGRVKSLRKHLALCDLGVHLAEIPPGLRANPLHDHLLEEEQFYLLSGTLVVTERTPDGARREFELHAGELLAYPAGTRIAHMLDNRGTEPACFVALSDQRPGDICTYPDSGKTNFRGDALGVGAWLPVAGDRPDARSTAAAALQEAAARRSREHVQALELGQRPSHVASASPVEGVLPREFLAGRGIALSALAGGRALSVERLRIAAGAPACPLHRHHFNEQALLLLSGRLQLRQMDDKTESRCVLEPGDIAHWPAKSAARQLINLDTEDATLLAFGTERPWNVVEFPELGELYCAALDQRGRFERLDYFAGEASAS